MDKIRIVGGQPLRGQIKISGAKNAALPLIAAAILTPEKMIFSNMPNLSDIHSMNELLTFLGLQVSFQDNVLTLDGHHITDTVAPYDIVRKMRASILVLGPLLARCGQAKVSLPGGCAIGTRPVDIHLKGLEAMGAVIELEDGYICASTPNGLHGAEFTLPIPSVTGTENLLMAACLAKGVTKLINVAREPEIADLAHCLMKMGAKIEGVGTDILTIQGVDHLKGIEYSVMPDRIETGTYAIAAAITGGNLELLDTSPELLAMFNAVLEQTGVEVVKTDRGFRVSSDGIIHPVDVSTEPYPGFPTDLQAQMMALLTISTGASMITETIWENRFMHVPELMRMGADISVQGSTALVRGVKKLKGAPVMATDLRASVSLVLAGLIADGETIVNRVYHLDRGYEELEKKLTACGAIIERIA